MPTNRDRCADWRRHILNAPKMRLHNIFFKLALITFTQIFPVLADESKEVFVISDISTWQHPVRKVLDKSKVTLSKVELYNNKRFPIIFVEFPYDPRTSATNDYFHKLYLDVLEANGYWEYAFNDQTDDLLITIHWNKASKKMTVDFEEISKTETSDAKPNQPKSAN